MTTRRTMVWLILFLVTVPTVAAAADTAQRLGEGDVLFTAGSYHEEERYEYELTFRSKLHDIDSTVDAYLTIDVGRVGSLTLPNGEDAPVLPLHYVTKTPPWLSAKGEVSEKNGTVYVRVPDATVVRTEETHHSVRYEMDPRDGLQRIEDTETRTVYGALRQGPVGATIREPLTRGIMEPGEQFIHGNEVVSFILAVTGVTGSHVYTTGTRDGETVYQVSKQSWQMDRALHFACHLRQPEVQYWDLASLERFGDEPVASTTEQAAWIDRDHPLPVESTCDARYVQGADLVEELHLGVALARHVPGGAAVPMEYTHGSLAQPEPLETEPVVLPGLPSSGGLAMAFPPEDIPGILASAPELAKFRNPGGEPLIVHTFHHQLGTPSGDPVAAAPPAPVPDPLDVLPRSPTPEPRVQALWSLSVDNARQERVSLLLTRTVDAGGSTVDEDMEVNYQTRAGAFTSEHYPREMVSLAAIFAAWRDARGMTVEEWEAYPHRSVSSENFAGSTADPLLLSTSYRVMAGAHVGDPGEFAWRATEGEFDSQTGAALSESSRSVDQEDASERPAGFAPSSTGAARIVAVEHVPAAAAASGLAVALAFVAAYFWDGISRVLIAPFYAKIRKDKVLDHRTRDQIAEYVEANPGATLGAVRLHISSGYGTAVHHLNTLERNGLLASRKVGRERCYFPAGRLSPGQMDLVAASGTDAAARFLHAIATEPGLTQQELAARLGVSGATVRYQAKRLLGHGGVRAERDGRLVRYYPPLPAVPPTGVEA